MTEQALGIDTGPYGKRLILRSRWSARIRDAIHEHRVVHLELTNPWDFPSRDLSFLCEFPFLRALVIVYGEIDIRPLECLRELRCLNVVNLDKHPIDFSGFTYLERLSVSWNTSVRGLVQLRKLKKLFINHPPKWVIPHIGEMTELEDLALLSCPAEDLSPIGNLTNLKELRLSIFRRNTHNAFMSNFVNLEELRIQECKGFTSLDPLRSLHKLKLISISESGPYASVEPLRGIHSLEHVHIGGEVLDGDYSPIENLPQLQRYYRRWR